MVVHPKGVGVSISSPLELGLDSQVSGLTSCGLLPIGMRKSSSETTRMTHQAHVDCIRAALTVSIRTQLIQLLPIIAIIGAIIVINQKRGIAIWLGI